MKRVGVGGGNLFLRVNFRRGVEEERIMENLFLMQCMN